MLNFIGFLFGAALCLLLIGVIGALIFVIVCAVMYAKGEITGKDNAIKKWVDDNY